MNPSEQFTWLRALPYVTVHRIGDEAYFIRRDVAGTRIAKSKRYRIDGQAYHEACTGRQPIFWKADAS